MSGRSAESQAAFLNEGKRGARPERAPFGRPGERPPGFGAFAGVPSVTRSVELTRLGEHRIEVGQVDFDRANAQRAEALLDECQGGRILLRDLRRMASASSARGTAGACRVANLGLPQP